MSELTPNQINAVLEAQTTRPELAELEAHAVGERLAQEGHAAFAPVDVELDDQAPAELAKTDSGFVPEGGEELGREDVQVPRLKIKMAGTENADGVKLGEWFNSVDPSLTANAITFAVLKVRPFLRYNSPHPSAEKDKKRAALAKAQGYGLNVDGDHKGAYCYSADRLTPEPSDSGTVRDKCKGCPARKAFDCRPAYELVALDLTDYGDGPAHEPVLLTLSGRAVKAWKSIQSLLMTRCRRGRKNFRDFKVGAKTVKDGTAYQPVFTLPEPIEDEALAEVLTDAYEVFAVAP